MDTSPARSQRTYDPRLRDHVRTTGDPDVVAELGVPRSTALGWLRGEYAAVVTAQILDMDTTRLQAEVCKLRGRVRMLAAIVLLPIALVRMFDVRTDCTRLPERAEKARLLRAIERARGPLSPSVLHMSPSRFKTRAGASGAVSSMTSRAVRGRRRRDRPQKRF